MHTDERQVPCHVEKTTLYHLSPNEFCQTKLRNNTLYYPVWVYYAGKPTEKYKAQIQVNNCN